MLVKFHLQGSSDLIILTIKVQCVTNDDEIEDVTSRKRCKFGRSHAASCCLAASAASTVQHGCPVVVMLVLLQSSCGGGGDVNMQSGQQVQSRCWLAFVWTRLGKNWDGFGFLWEMFSLVYLEKTLKDYIYDAPYTLHQQLH